MTEETERRVARMRHTPQELRSLLAGGAEALLARRPSPTTWSATEIVCHLRDVEEFYLHRVRFILANRDPTLVGFDPDRWAIERQYHRGMCMPALEAFAARRRETLSLLEALGDEAWERGGAHLLRGWMTVRRITHGWAKHDTEHAEQIARALDGRP